MTDRFVNMDEEKRLRIINAAMREFGRWGYKQARTDNIASEAGISKGLLFHYFGTKKQLFRAVLDYAVSLFDRQFGEMSMAEDILERILHNTKLKMEYIRRYPGLIGFAVGIQIKGAGEMQDEVASRMEPMNRRIYATMYEGLDLTKFRDDVDPLVAVNIIMWTVEGFSNKIIAEYQAQFEGQAVDDIESRFAEYIDELKQYLNTLRHSLYK